MNKWPLANFVLIINKASIYKVASICEMIKEYSSASCISLYICPTSI